MNDDSNPKPLTRVLDNLEKIAADPMVPKTESPASSTIEPLVAFLVFAAVIGLICFLA